MIADREWRKAEMDRELEESIWHLKCDSKGN